MHKLHDRDRIVKNRRAAGLVERYHAWPTIRKQTVAEHCWQIMRIYCELFGAPPTHVWEYILHHDSAEIVTGDIPFPVKSSNPAIKEAMDELEQRTLTDLGINIPTISQEEKLQVKICDLFEMLEFAVDEILFGSSWAEPIKYAIEQYLIHLMDYEYGGSFIAHDGEIIREKIRVKIDVEHARSKRN